MLECDELAWWILDECVSCSAHIPFVQHCKMWGDPDAGLQLLFYRWKHSLVLTLWWPEGVTHLFWLPQACSLHSPFLFCLLIAGIYCSFGGSTWQVRYGDIQLCVGKKKISDWGTRKVATQLLFSNLYWWTFHELYQKATSLNAWPVMLAVKQPAWSIARITVGIWSMSAICCGIRQC